MGTLSRIISRDDCYLKKVGVGVHSADTDLAMTPQQQDMDTLNAGSVSGELSAILEKKKQKKAEFWNKGCYGRDVPKLICHTAKTGLWITPCHFKFCNKLFLPEKNHIQIQRKGMFSKAMDNHKRKISEL